MSELNGNGHVDEAVLDLAGLSQEDQNILSAMCSPNSRVRFQYDPRDPDPEVVLQNLQIAVVAIAKLESRRDLMVHMVGKILWVIQQNPRVYHAARYASFTSFLKGYVVKSLRMSESTLRMAMSIYRSFPAVDARTVAEVGIVKMNHLAKCTDYTNPGHENLIEKAKSLTLVQLKKVVCERTGMTPGDMFYTDISIRATNTQAKAWREFSGNPLVQAYCQSEDPATILECMIAEVVGEWGREQEGEREPQQNWGEESQGDPGGAQVPFDI